MLTSYAEACKLKVIASTHSITCLFALVCFDLPAPLPEGWSHKWVQLHTGEWRQACVAALSGTLPQWGKEPHLAQCPQDLAVQEAQTTLRAVCPQEFLSAADWKEAQSKPQRLVAKLLPENLWARSYGWHAETREACIVGFLKVPSQACDQVLQASGERGVFFSAVRDKNTPAPSGVRWLPRDDKVTAEVYLQTAQKQAAVAAAPLAFRRGGRASLGIVGEGTTVAESSSLRLRWAAKSVPRHWSPTQFRRMLDAQAWRVVPDLQPPARPGGVWTFAAARPEGRSEDCFVLGLEGKSIVIVPS